MLAGSKQLAKESFSVEQRGRKMYATGDAQLSTTLLTLSAPQQPIFSSFFLLVSGQDFCWAKRGDSGVDELLRDVLVKLSSCRDRCS